MRKLTILLLGLLSYYYGSAQQITLKGKLKDTSDNKILHQAVVQLVRTSDSVLVAFSRAGTQGQFSIGNLDTGKYLLWATYPNYADFVEPIDLRKDLDIGEVILTPKSQLLEEVIIKQRIAAIRMKGDTLEFRADSFAVREGANVEELLKKLPGITVNKNGEITAQGEKVQKVLVDGEEFFSDDPAVVTQNLRADAVENVQVFDKKSDQAAFTGIDDGEKTKTINLKLKEDRKKGVFGKARVAGGTPDWFENEGMINSFKGKRKMAAFGTMANTGKAGLNGRDADKFGGSSNNMEYNEEDGFFYSFSTEDEFNTWGGRYNGEGLPRAWTAGAHFSNKWDNDKNHINGNYRYYKQNIEVEGNNFSQFITKDTQYFNNEARKTYNQNIRNQVIGFYEVKMDSSSSIKINVTGSHVSGKSASRFDGNSLDEDSSLVNTNLRQLSSDGTKQTFNSSIIYRKKFKKTGRTLSLSMDQTYNDQNTNGFLLSDIDFYDGSGNQMNSIMVDQQKLNKNNQLGINSKISYTEPLFKNSFVELNYSYRLSNSEAERISYNKSNEGKYDILDSIYSNDYRFRFSTHSSGVNFRVNTKKLNYSVGTNVAFTDFNQTDLGRNNVYKYSYTNLFPKASFRYKIKPQTGFSLNYNGSTNQPTLQQIQPILDNSNTLNIQIGNPNLKQEFRHSLNFNFNDFKILSGRSIWISGGYQATDNAISTSSFVSKGVRTTQYVNVSGNYNFSVWAGYWLNFKKLNLRVGLSSGFNSGKFNNYIDSLKNTNNNKSVDLSINFNLYKDNKYDIYLRPGWAYNNSRSSINPSAVTKYWTSESEAGATVQITKKLEINSELNVNIRQRTQVFTRNVNNTKWNAYIAQKFWKNNTGEIRLSVFDILDQNIGFSRNSQSNFILENTYNTIRRYWLVSFTWNFSSNGAMANTNQ